MGDAHHLHHYSIQLTWTGNHGQGTAGYKAYGRDHEITAPGKPVLRASSDVIFRGDPDRYNPEELLVAALSSCHMLTYLHLCADAGIRVVHYRDKAHGTMQFDPGGSEPGRFTEVVLQPRVSLAPGSDGELAQALHEKARLACFIANSVNFPVRCEPKVEPAARA